MNKKAILFIARRYPPSIGGIQTFCHRLHSRLCVQRPVRLLALGHDPLYHLGWFLPWVFVRSAWLLLLNRVSVVYFADGVAAAVAPLLRPLNRRARFVVTVYGLEMTFKNKLARGLMVKGIATCDKVAVISENTRALTEKMGIDPKRITLIYVGVEPLQLAQQPLIKLRTDFEREHGLTFGKDRVLLNFGRLIPRKGVAAFLEKGMALLSPDIRLIIGGGGIDYERVCAIVKQRGYEKRVILLSAPSDELIAMLRQSADLFLFPNVPTPGDAEGFGMTQLESMCSGMPVVAFAVDALVESVREGGYLIEPNDYQAFVDTIHQWYGLSQQQRQAKRNEALAYVTREYSWERTTQRYLELFES
jgi:glycosyltransferase involved in cell wall biosynthesis